MNNVKHLDLQAFKENINDSFKASRVLYRLKSNAKKHKQERMNKKKGRHTTT